MPDDYYTWAGLPLSLTMTSLTLITFKGVRRSYQFQRQVYPDISHVTALVSSKTSDGKELSECIFGQIFKDAIRSSRLYSTRILRSLFALFTNPNKHFNDHTFVQENHDVMDVCGENSSSFLCRIPLLSFTAEIIAHLPYNHLGDVLFIVHHVSGNIAMEGNDFMMRFAEFLYPFGLTNNEDGDLTEEDIIEKAARGKSSSQKNVLKIIQSKKFDISKFADMCAEASVMVLLLRLKLHLRQAYSGVTEVRLREYLPNEKEKITDRGASPLAEMSRFNADIPKPYKVDGQTFDKGALIKQYSEFRRLMRGNYDFHTHDDDEE